MTEEEKALAGMLYYAKEESLQKERERSQELSYAYNQLRPCQVQEREEMIRREMKKTGKNFRIEEPFHCDFWGRVTLGEISLRTIIWSFWREMRSPLEMRS